MDEELTEKLRRIRVQDTKPRRERRKEPRQYRGRFGIWRLTGILLLVLAMVTAGMALSGRAVVLPEWVAHQIENRVNSAMTSGRITVGQVQILVSKRGVPRLQFHNLGVFDGRGAEIIRLNDVGIRVSTAAIFKGELKADRIQLGGAQMTLRRRNDGQFDISFGGGERATLSLPEALDVLDRIFANAPLDSVNLVEAEALTVNVEDGRSGRLWQITDGRMQLSRLPDGLDITVAFDVFNGTEDLAEIVVGVLTKRDSSAATIGTTFSNAAAADIALQSPVLSFLGILNAPISGALRTGFSEQGTLTTLTGTLEIETGALQPTLETPPVFFESGKAYFDYDPVREKISFSELSVQTDAISLNASGHAYLNDFKDGWPSTLLAQIALSDLKIDPTDVFDDPVVFSKGAMDFRLNLDPFTVDFGQIVLSEGEERLQADGKISAIDQGWQVSANMALNQMNYPRLMTLWPPVLVPKTRKWLAENVFDGIVRDVTAAVRLETGKEPRHTLGFRFEDATVRYIKTLPHIKNGAGFGSILGKRFTLALEKGKIAARQGGEIFVRGTKLTIENVTQKPATMNVDITGNASITAALSLLSEPPFRVLKNSKLPVDLAQGQVHFDANASFPMKKKLQLESVSYQVKGRLSDVSSAVLIKNRVITAKELALTANKQFVDISGETRLGKATGDVTWHQKMGPQNVGISDLNGSVALSQGFSEEFNLGLPNGAITGSGHGDIEIKFRKGTPPEYKLTSDLSQVGIAIAPIGWTKSSGSTGSFSVEGTLGDNPKISQLSLAAPGLNVTGGRVNLRSGGGLNKATFDRVQVGGWLDAPVELTGRGNGASPAVRVPGGELDIRKTSFGGAGGQTSRPTGGPITLAMDRVTISEGISLTNFSANLNSNRGLSGIFTARVNGKSPLRGTLLSERNGVAIRLQSDDAGALARDAGLIEKAFGGTLDVTLRPTTTKGVYNGRLEVRNTRIVNASAMTELLNVISIVGLLDQLRGPGIQFSEIEGDFALSPTTVQLKRSSAVGPSLGISLDGIYDLTTSRMRMQGVLSPVYFLNGIGRIFSPRSGEGLFGFNFQINGTSEEPQVRVNPLSILTPGMFREIFRRPPPKVK